MAISYLFRPTTITSEQHSTEPCTEVVVLIFRGLGSRFTYFVIVGPFLCQCFSHVETSQLICVTNRAPGFYVELTWKKLNIYPY